MGLSLGIQAGSGKDTVDGGPALGLRAGYSALGSGLGAVPYQGLEGCRVRSSSSSKLIAL